MAEFISLINQLPNYSILAAPLLAGAVYLKRLIPPVDVKKRLDVINYALRIGAAAIESFPVGEHNITPPDALFRYFLKVYKSGKDTVGQVIVDAGKNSGGTMLNIDQDVDSPEEVQLKGPFTVDLKDRRGEIFVISEPVDPNDQENDQIRIHGIIWYKPDGRDSLK